MLVVGQVPPTSAIARSRRSAERGVVLIAGMFGLMVLLALGALVVDLLRMERIARSLQRAADAASLAGTLYLKGDPYSPPAETLTEAGWRGAKRAAILALRNNLIAEGTNELSGGTTWNGAGTFDPWEVGDPTYNGTEATIGNLKFTIERGAWLYQEVEFDSDPDQTGPYFVSLESNDGKCPGICEVYNHQAANAVRVRVQMTGMRSFFPLAWAGNSEVGALSRDAVSAKEATGVIP